MEQRERAVVVFAERRSDQRDVERGAGDALERGGRGRGDVDLETSQSAARASVAPFGSASITNT